MKKLLLFLLLSIFLVSLASAEVNPCGSTNAWLGRGEQGKPIQLKQICDTCTYVNVSRIIYPDSTFTSIESIMTKSGVNYNYTFTDTFDLGCYSYIVKGDKDGVANTTAIFDFQITPSGQGGNENTIFYIFIIVIIYGLALIGFFGENEVLTLFGAIPMFLLGIFLVAKGFIIFRTSITLALGYISIGLGAYLSYEAIRSYWE